MLEDHGPGQLVHWDDVRVTSIAVGLCAAALAGCLSAPPSSDCRDESCDPDAAQSVIVDGGPPADAPCPIETMAFAVQADGHMLPNPDQAHGENDLMNVGVELASRGLVRFDVTSLPLDRERVALRILLTYPAEHSGCSPDCGSCGGIDDPGRIVLSYATSNWDEDTFHWTERRGGVSWGMEGASELDTDRSATIGTTPHLDDTSTAVVADPEFLGTDFEDWLEDPFANEARLLSFRLSPADTAVMVVATREDGECDDYPAPTLEIDLCKP